MLLLSLMLFCSVLWAPFGLSENESCHEEFELELLVQATEADFPYFRFIFPNASIEYDFDPLYSEVLVEAIPYHRKQ